MEGLEILKDRKFVFVEDAIESKKVVNEVKDVNNAFSQMVDEINHFDDFEKSVQEGELNKTIAYAKALEANYKEWKAFENAYNKFMAKESFEIADYNAKKTVLLESLNKLLVASQKESVVALFDFVDGVFQECEKGHEVVILGEHGKVVIEKLIEEFEKKLVVYGHSEEVKPCELKVNYSIVEKNVDLCNTKIQELFANKPNKISKLTDATNIMQEIGKKIVFFETFKQKMLDMGLTEKDVEGYEKNFTKQYMGLKNLLQKKLGVNFEEICDIKVDESSFEETKEEDIKPFEEFPKDETTKEETKDVEAVENTVVGQKIEKQENQENDSEKNNSDKEDKKIVIDDSVKIESLDEINNKDENNDGDENK